MGLDSFILFYPALSSGRGAFFYFFSTPLPPPLVPFNSVKQDGLSDNDWCNGLVVVVGGGLSIPSLTTTVC